MLTALTGSDPPAAVAAARALEPDDLLDQLNVDALKAGTLIDAGSDAKDASAVEQGVELASKILEQRPDDPHARYNLANGLNNLAEISAAGRSDWYFRLAEALRDSRLLFQAVAGDDAAPYDLRARASTNLANSLLRVYRVIEAYDWYSRAIELDPTNGVALTGAARALLYLANRSIGDQQRLRAVARRHIDAARIDPSRIEQLAGPRAFVSISKLLELELPDVAPPALDDATDYQRFVHRHRLALSPSIDGLEVALPRWDTLQINSVTVAIHEGAGVPPIFAMFNTLKSDYLCARFLAFTALADATPESGTYLDTLDYADYGIDESAMLLAQRACLDILDKLAVATCEYFAIDRKPRSIGFRNTWFIRGAHNLPTHWLPEAAGPVGEKVTAIIALADMSRDIEDGGFLRQKLMMRNSSTHRFLVLHDMEAEPSRPSRYVDHVDAHAFREHLIETLQLTRAALFYFVEMIVQAEHRHHGDGKFRPQMFIPDHADVRGEDC